MLTVAALSPPAPWGEGRRTPRRRKGYFCMMLDKKSVERLLRLNDDQLRGVIGKMLGEYGVDVSRIPLATMDVGAIRALLQMAGEADVARLLGALGGAPSGGPSGTPAGGPTGGPQGRA